MPSSRVWCLSGASCDGMKYFDLVRTCERRSSYRNRSSCSQPTRYAAAAAAAAPTYRQRYEIISHQFCFWRSRDCWTLDCRIGAASKTTTAASLRVLVFRLVFAYRAASKGRVQGMIPKLPRPRSPEVLLVRICSRRSHGPGGLFVR